MIPLRSVIFARRRLSRPPFRSPWLSCVVSLIGWCRTRSVDGRTAVQARWGESCRSTGSTYAPPLLALPVPICFAPLASQFEETDPGELKGDALSRWLTATLSISDAGAACLSDSRISGAMLFGQRSEDDLRNFLAKRGLKDDLDIEAIATHYRRLRTSSVCLACLLCRLHMPSFRFESGGVLCLGLIVPCFRSPSSGVLVRPFYHRSFFPLASLVEFSAESTFGSASSLCLVPSWCTLLF